MKKAIKSSLVLTLFYVAVFLCFYSICSGVEYTYTELLPPGWGLVHAYGINDSGVVVGSVYDGTGVTNSFIYINGKYTEILSPGWRQVAAFAINNNNVVVGCAADNNNVQKGFIYSNGQYTELLPPGWAHARAWSINNNGVVVGEGRDGNRIYKGFIYSNGQYTELLPPGWDWAQAWGINDNGVVVGLGDDNNNIKKGFIYSNGQYTELLPPGWDWAQALAINNNGVVAGNRGDNNITKTFIYSNGQYTELLPPGWDSAGTLAMGINDAGMVVSSGWDGNSKGFIYSNGEYAELLPPGWAYASATDINNTGVVVGAISNDDPAITKGFIAVPVTLTTTTTAPAVNPTIAQTPMSGPPGTTFTQWGTGFTPNSTATLHIKKPDNTEYSTQNQPIDSTGHFEITYTAAIDKTAGTYTWWAIDSPTGIKSNEVEYEITPSPSNSILNVPLYSQNNKEWACEQLGACKCDVMGECPGNKGACVWKNKRSPSGCTVTSLAMIYNYLAPGSRTPQGLNDFLTNNKGYSWGCYMKWPATGQQPSGAPSGTIYEGKRARIINIKGVDLLKNNKSVKDEVNSYLVSGLPVLADVECQGVSQHFVVIVGKTENSYWINDPWDGKLHTLDKGAFGYPYTVKAVHFYSYY